MTLTEEQLGNILDNTLKKYTLDKKDYYYMLIKKQKDKNYSTLYITDHCSHFWIQKINISYCNTLKQLLHLSSDLKSFTKHLIYSVKQKSQLVKTKTNNIHIEVQMEIGEGLLMKCQLKIETHISLAESPENWKQLMRIFGLQLWQAQQLNRKQIENKYDQIKTSEQIKKQKQDTTYAKDILIGNTKKNMNFKNRSLINPNHRKKTADGAKLFHYE